jgi:hypothetical protein
VTGQTGRVFAVEIRDLHSATTWTWSAKPGVSGYPAIHRFDGFRSGRGSSISALRNTQADLRRRGAHHARWAAYQLLGI